MIKGIERRVVEMKLTGNRFYERACLILKVDEKIGVPDERELIEEARRIVSQIGISPKGERRRAILRFAFAFLCFFIGIFTGVCAMALIK